MEVRKESNLLDSVCCILPKVLSLLSHCTLLPLFLTTDCVSLNISHCHITNLPHSDQEEITRTSVFLIDILWLPEFIPNSQPWQSETGRCFVNYLNGTPHEVGAS